LSPSPEFRRESRVGQNLKDGIGELVGAARLDQAGSPVSDLWNRSGARCHDGGSGGKCLDHRKAEALKH
jgi:hypothetical protein